ncbi:hypothetical protein AAG584_06790 [Vreelandella titanicae]|jgi:hypothetical protein|nr:MULTISPECIES: hypothetical protein [Halomonas]MCD1588484.1 hypothetical protein [Halomonas sp. IOP_14]MCE7519890.1 hypothetical protein [Halomonas titanicae]
MSTSVEGARQLECELHTYEVKFADALVARTRQAERILAERAASNA